MNKSELVDAIASEAKLTKVLANKVVDATVKSITESLEKGEKVTLVGFGTFSIANRSARVGRNPKTGESISIKAKKVAKFKAGKELKENVNDLPKTTTKVKK